MEIKSNRRSCIRTAAADGTTAALGGCSANTGNENDEGRLRSGDQIELPESLPKGLEYVLKVRTMLQDIKDNDAEKFARAADICAEAVAAGNKVYYSVYGHNEAQQILETKPGRPSFLIPVEQRKSDALDMIGEGDVLISQNTGHCETVARKGAKTIGILYAFTPKKFQGQGIVHVGYQGPYMEDICDVWFWDRTPFTVGIMDFDLLPWKSVSAHGALDGFILGMLLSATVDRLLERGIPVNAV